MTMAVILALFCLCIVGISAEPEEMRTDDDPNARFDYSPGPYGPEQWGRLRDDWHLCETGYNQSPMEMEPDMMVLDPQMGPLRAVHNSANATIVNNGRTIQVWWPGAGSLVIGNTTYHIKDIDFHTPSEHTLGLFNERFPLEMHLVYRTRDHEKIAVIALLFAFGDENRFLAQFWDRLPPLSQKNQMFSLGELDPSYLNVGRHYGRYLGSETHPPCNEGVLWSIVHVEGRSVSMKQVVKLKAALKSDNARPLQRGNGRKYHFL